MDSYDISWDLRDITAEDCKYNSIGVFADAFENIVEVFPKMDPYLHYELAKEVMKIECSMNHESYSLKVDQNSPDNMLDIPLQNIADAISGYEVRGDKHV
ncbi:MAG: hypothetical protein ACTJHZ_10030 [Vagococcus sp.]|nr:hypothetical protein [Staphylococcus equorum]